MLEDQSRRIAHALHDDAGQMLVTVHFTLAAMEAEQPAMRERVDELRTILQQVQAQIRQLSHELHAPMLEELGLIGALEFLAQGVASRTGVPIDIEVDGAAEPKLPLGVAAVLYRVMQEAINNATRHGRPGRILVSLHPKPELVVCEVEDDGVGFDVALVMAEWERRGLGLVGMRERVHAIGGQLDIQSSPGRGTRVKVELPFAGVTDETAR